MRVVYDGVRYDGVTAQRDPVEVTVTATGLRVAGGEDTEWWPYDEVVRVPGVSRGDPVRLQWGAFDEAPAVVVDDPTLLQAIARAADDGVARHLIPRRLAARAIAVLAGAVAAAGALLYFWVIPGLAVVVAQRVPVAWEEQLGRRVSEVLAPVGARCEGEAADAVRGVVDRLAAGRSRYTWRVALWRSDAVNAFAAPGGFLVVTTGLLAHTERTEQLAGVLAHEIQHVEQQHGTRGLLRSAPLRLILAAAAGDAGGLSQLLGTAANLGMLRYKRHDETAADQGAVAVLVAAGVDPAGLSDFLEGIEGTEVPAGLGALSTHPRTGERVAALRRRPAAVGTFEPLLPETDWRALAGRCR